MQCFLPYEKLSTSGSFERISHNHYSGRLAITLEKVNPIGTEQITGNSLILVFFHA